jgi:hypothetical protein
MKHGDRVELLHIFELRPTGETAFAPDGSEVEVMDRVYATGVICSDEHDADVDDVIVAGSSFVVRLDVPQPPFEELHVASENLRVLDP